MSLHNQIMELPTQDRHLEDWSNTRMAWLAGFDTGLHEAAEIAKEADELIEALADAVRRYESGQPAELQADHAINMYSRYKESAK